jgi:Flp pilus assembly protein protease CpaA
VVQDATIKIILVIWLFVCAWQDFREGEVSNWLTIPAMLASGIFALISGRDAFLFYVAVLVGVFILFYIGNFGGADAKILVVLAGYWPWAFIAAILVQGVWGLVMLVRKGRTAGFRAVPTYAAGVLVCLLMGIITKGG